MKDDPRSYFYEPKNGCGLSHDPLNSIIGPRPVGWISTIGRTGIPNLAPYSFFNAFSYKPPIIGFSSTTPKDSLRNVQETREFVWNLVSRPLVEQMNVSSASVPYEVDEFKLAGLTPAPCRLVSAQRVRESLVNFECKVTEIIP